jgi:3-isopropylmalate/(R)-2-methylmalate dehydratase small subunit
LPVLICPEADRIDDGDEISLRVDDGIVLNHTTGEQYQADPLPEFLQNLVDSGGLKPYTKAKIDAE